MSHSSLLLLLIFGPPLLFVAAIQDPDWNAFLTKFGKEYPKLTEELRRYEIFKEAQYRIRMHNMRFRAGRTTYTLGLNQYSDMTEEERSQRRGLKIDFASVLTSSNASYFVRQKSLTDLPKSLNWTERGCVTRVKDQAACGSCWAFSTLGSLEGVTCVATGKLEELSEQQLVDCCYVEDKCMGCDGADPREAFVYIKETGGVMRETDYPYKAKNDTCKFKPAKAVERDRGFVQITPEDEEGLAEALATYGPVSVGINTTPDFEEYKSGVFDDPECNDTPYPVIDHGVLLVGYGVTGGGIPYWIIRNSWGTSWGDNGYFLLRRGKNACFVTLIGVFPKL